MDEASQRMSTQKRDEISIYVKWNTYFVHRELAGSDVYTSYTVHVRQTVIKKGNKMKNLET
jgi:hypothetical protein